MKAVSPQATAATTLLETCTRDTKRKKSSGTQIHDLFIARRVLYRSAAATAHASTNRFSRPSQFLLNCFKSKKEAKVVLGNKIRFVDVRSDC